MHYIRHTLLLTMCKCRNKVPTYICPLQRRKVSGSPHSSQIIQWLQLISPWLLISAQCTTYSFSELWSSQKWLQDCFLSFREPLARLLYIVHIHIILNSSSNLSKVNNKFTLFMYFVQYMPSILLSTCESYPYDVMLHRFLLIKSNWFVCVYWLV